MSAIDTSGLQSAELASRVSVAVAVKAKSAAKAQGEAVVSMLEDAARMQQQLASAAPHLGRRVDARG